MNQKIIVYSPVQIVDTNGLVLQPVGGFLGSIGKFLGKAVKAVSKVLPGKLGQAVRGVAGVITGGISELVFTAGDLANRDEAKKKLKQAAAKADAKTYQTIKNSYDKLKKESDEFRAARKLPPLPAALPVPLNKASPEAILIAFDALQNDAMNIVKREEAAKLVSTKQIPVNNTLLIVGGIALAATALIAIRNRRR